MKHLITLAIVLSAATAFATRARVTALGNSPHLIDASSSAPDQLLSLGDSLTIESGKGGSTGLTNLPVGSTGVNNTITTNAEGTLYKSVAGGKIGLTLGHQDAMIYNLRALAANLAPGVIDAQQNPITLSYALRLADLNAGFGLIYSNYDNKAGNEKENSMGVVAGVSSSLFYANAKLIVADTYKNATGDYKGKMGFDLKGGMHFGDLSVHANVASSGAKITPTGGGTDIVDASIMTYSVKVIDTIKSDSNLFYGVGLASTTGEEKVASPASKITTMSLPIIIGVEAPATTWMTFRGSVTQDVLISSSKTEGTALFTPAGEFAPGLNTTTFAAGVGLNFNKITVDGSILAAGSQVINSANLLGQVGLAYNF